MQVICGEVSVLDLDVLRLQGHHGWGGEGGRP